MITAQDLLDRMTPRTILSLLQDMSEVVMDWNDEEVRMMCADQLAVIEGEEKAAEDLRPFGLEALA